MADFDIIGIVFIVIAALFFFIGFARGLIRGALHLFRGFLAATIASMLSKPVASWMTSFSFIKDWTNNLVNSFAEKGGVFTEIYTEASVDQVRAQLKLPEFLKGMFEGLAKYFVTDGTQTVATVLGQTIIFYACMVIAFLILFLAMQILSTILINCMKGLQQSLGVASIPGRILGGILYAAVGVLFDCMLCYVLTMLVGLGNGVSDWLITTMHLNDDQFTVSKFLYNNNFLGMLITWVQGWFVK